MQYFKIKYNIFLIEIKIFRIYSFNFFYGEFTVVVLMCVCCDF